MPYPTIWLGNLTYWGAGQFQEDHPSQDLMPSVNRGQHTCCNLARITAIGYERLILNE
jgi:hypothetical protein